MSISSTLGSGPAGTHNLRSNQLISILQIWYEQRDSMDWVLGTIYQTEGPAYRKAGAMMLFNSLGQQFGMLSGGCLESDIQTHARRVMQAQKATQVVYDGSDEDDLSFQLGIGCGGKVSIMLQSIHANNQYMQLDKLLTQLQERTACIYWQNLSEPDSPNRVNLLLDETGGALDETGWALDGTGGALHGTGWALDEMDEDKDVEAATDDSQADTSSLSHNTRLKTQARAQQHPQQRSQQRSRQRSQQRSQQAHQQRTQIVSEGEGQFLQNVIVPQPHLLVVGGGVDARPVVTLAHHLGWRVSLWDPRPANARKEYFMHADQIVEVPIEQLQAYAIEHKVDSAVLMSHNLSLDAQALAQLNGIHLSHWALLGPQSRRQNVLQTAELSEQQLSPKLSGPAGFDLGAELPESIALAILAEAHMVLKGASGRLLS